MYYIDETQMINTAIKIALNQYKIKVIVIVINKQFSWLSLNS